MHILTRLLCIAWHAVTIMYKPKQGDIIYLDFDPQAGREQAGRRPAIVVSNESYNHYTNLAIVCPITNTDRQFPLHIPLGKKTKTKGFILCEHVKTQDLNARNAEYKETAPDELIQEVLDKIELFFKYV